jgi:hypothetical protein
VLGHGLAEFAPDLERVLRARVVEQGSVLFLLALEFGSVAAVAGLRGQRLGVLQRVRAGDEAAVDAAEQRVRAEAVRAVDGVVRLARRVDAGDVGLLVEVHPQAAHGVVDAGEDLHRHLARVVADELLVDLKDAVELVQLGRREVRDVEVDHRLAVDAHVVGVDDLEDLARGDVARHQVAVLGIALFEEVPAVGLGDGLRRRACRCGRAAPRRGRLRRARTPTSGAACLRRGWRWGAPG